MNRDRLEAQIRSDEGYSLYPYRDSLGFWTVGTGHLIHESDIRSYEPDRTIGNVLDRLSDPANHARWLAQDVQRAISDARRYIGSEAFENLTDERREVLASMAFQLGLPKLTRFTKLRQAILEFRWVRAHDEMIDSLWYRQTPQRAMRLASRMLEG